MIFKTHKNNINQIKGAIVAHGPVYFHGDGNIYPADETLHSDNNVTYSNPKQEEAKYRVKFSDIKEVPGTVEALNKMLMDAKNKEILAEQKSVATEGVKTFKAYEEPTVSKADAIQVKLEKAIAKAGELKIKAEGEKATDKQKADYEKAQADVSTLTEEYNQALAE